MHGTYKQVAKQFVSDDDTSGFCRTTIVNGDLLAKDSSREEWKEVTVNLKENAEKLMDKKFSVDNAESNVVRVPLFQSINQGIQAGFTIDFSGSLEGEKISGYLFCRIESENLYFVTEKTVRKSLDELLEVNVEIMP